MSITPANLATVTTAIQTVETLAVNAVAQGTAAPTNAQKLEAAISLASAIDPAIGVWVVPAEALINALVGVFNIFGIFKHHPAA